MKKKIAIIGTNGIPSKYGGFETLVEYLVKYLSESYELTVFCSSKTNTSKIKEYNGCKLRYVNLEANGWQSVPYDIISLYKSYKDYDKILILGASGSIVAPLFRKYKDKFIFLFGGLDWDRSKWSYLTRNFLKLSESLGIKNSTHLISDNAGIQNYISKTYNRESHLIAYGGDQVFKVDINTVDQEKYNFLKFDYAFSVARIQPDNNIILLLESFNEESNMPFVLVGNWKNSTFGINTKNKYKNTPNLILLDAIYEHRELNLLRSNCKVYLHGHSAGGTNPALVEAMNLGLPIIAYDCIFNNHTTNFKANYFRNSGELKNILAQISDEELKINGNHMLAIANDLYKWEHIANKYSELFNK
ncbi:MAG: glycosyltransferase involved in cell wall biosynthesis [Flavobacteriaceae bacterium]|jgi:glycosyltransferase involved in cell wall biosynthesis